MDPPACLPSPYQILSCYYSRHPKLTLLSLTLAFLTTLISTLATHTYLLPFLHYPKLRPRGIIRCGASRTYPRLDPTVRLEVSDTHITIYAWPSAAKGGGVIVHDHADLVDFDFLGLSRINPPMERYANQEEEDAFAQRLLMVGGKWFWSEWRFSFINRLQESNDFYARDAVDEGREQWPTWGEARWVCVGYPQTGGLVVSEFDTPIYGYREEDNWAPDGLAWLGLCGDMEERCAMLRERSRGRFYEEVREYDGYAFLNAWEEIGVSGVKGLRQHQRPEEDEEEK